MKQTLASLFLLLCCAGVSYGQGEKVQIVSAGGTYKINKYVDQKGFFGSVSEFVFQDSKGYVWACTRSGLNRLDGSEIVNFTTQDGLANDTPRCMAEDENGLLWIGTIDGLSVYNGKSFYNLNTKDGLSHSQIWSLLPCKEGGMLVGTTFGIDRIYQGKIESYYRHDTIAGVNTMMRYMHYDSKGDLWLGTDREVLVMRDGKVKKIMDSFASQGWAETKDGTIWLSSWNPYLVNYKNGVITEFDIGTPVNSIKVDTEDNVWLGTWEKGLLRLENDSLATQFDLNEGLTVSSIWHMMIDSEGTIWFSTFGAGVEQLVNERFSLYSTKNGLTSDIVNDIGIDKEETLWLATEGGLTSINKNGESRTYSEKEGLSNTKVQGLLVDDNSDVWCVLYEETSGLFKLHDDRIQNMKNTGGFRLLQDSHGAVWWGSDNSGALRLDEKGNIKQIKDREGSRNRVVEVAQTEDDKVWLGVYYGGWKYYDYVTDSVYSNILPDYLRKETGLSIAFDQDGEIWTGMGERGLFRFRLTDNELILIDSLKREDGLLANKISSLFVEDDDMWIATDLGLSKFNLEAYKQNGTANFTHLTAKEGFKGESYSKMFRKSENELLIGTSKGLLVYHEDKDKKIESQPFTIISQLLLNKTSIDWTTKDAIMKSNSTVPESVNLTYLDNHLTFIYKGISFSAPEEVRFQYMLEGFDDDWSPLTGHSEITYSNIPAGDYVFKVKARNIDGVWDETPEEISIHISPPFWETWTFRIFVILLLSLLVFALFKLRLKKLQKAKTLLEDKVTERTHELKNAFFQIEEKNLEITDSISYALRIQRAILPPLSDFDKLMSDQFVLYKPKDIVAGDFYWFNEIEGKYLFAVGDCTGHGVPGAMVSVVCVGALNRSIREFGLSKPSDILDKTRELVLETFEKSEEDVKDGMDISLCSWDERTGELEFSGANNNLYLVKGSEISEIKADKQPIGKYEYAKPFVNHAMKLEKDTCVYIFSDGFADQFGGEKGKKMKYKAFRELLVQNMALPMSVQLKELDEKFDNWKGEFEQVDDVCVIGVRV